MQRAKNIQRLMNLSCVTRRIASPHIELPQIYFSINEDNSIKRHTDIIRATIGNPLYILCFISVPYPKYGGGFRSKNEMVAMTDRKGNTLENIALNNWKVLDISFDYDGLVDSIDIVSEFGTCILKPTVDKMRMNIEYNWKMLIEIDSECDTPKEAQLYRDYFTTKSHLNQADFSIDKYKKEINKKDNIISQYQDLLEKFQEIVDRGEIVSKT